MKYLLLIALTVAVVWLWRHNRQAQKAAYLRQAAAVPAPLAAVEIVACGMCGVHLPKSDALVGLHDATFYCSDAHRREAEH